MRTLILFIFLMPTCVFAEAPECPIYANKSLCLQSVEENYKNFLDFLNEEDIEDKNQKDELIQAANDTKHFESLACQKTCLN